MYHKSCVYQWLKVNRFCQNILITKAVDCLVKWVINSVLSQLSNWQCLVNFVIDSVFSQLSDLQRV